MKMQLFPDFELHGEANLVARNVGDGSVAWTAKKTNLITDLGRRVFLNLGFNSLYLFTSPSIETPLIGRSTLADDLTCQFSNLITSTYDSIAVARSYFFSFPTPASNKTIAAVGLSAMTGANVGVRKISAYTTLTPPKVQTPLLTLELNYRVLFVSL
jgi:hypothetical protein